ncbi:MAG: outer membrane protein [Polaribacter sp.]|jgi:outer membrane protein
MYKTFLIISFSLFSGSLLAQNLVDVYQLAKQNDASLKIAQANYQATGETLPLAISTRRPQINLSVQQSIKESDNSNTGTNTNQNLGYTLSLTQTIYNARTSAQVDSAEAIVNQAAANLKVAEQDLVIRVATSYFAILSAQDSVKFARAEQNAIARQLEQAQKRFEVGLIAITDVHEAQALYDRSLAQSLLAENQLDNAFQALQVMTAEPPSSTLAELGDQLTLIIPHPADIQAWVDTSLLNNQTLEAALAASRAAKFELDRQSRGDYPTVDLNASYNGSRTGDDSLGDFNQDDLSLMLQLNIPLFTGGRIDATRQQAASNYLSAQNTALLQNRLTSQQTRIAYLGVVSGIGQVRAFKQALNSSTTALKATEAGFEVGTRTSVDVLVSLRETFRAERDYSSARYDYLVNTLKLKQAAGLLSLDDLTAINRWLSL